VHLADEQRLVAAATRDPTAFAVLYQHYFPRLYAYARYRTPGVHEAEEVVADTFLKVVESLDRFRWQHDHSFAAWVFRIAHNVLVDRTRRRRRDGELVSLSELADVPGDREPVVERLIQEEELARIRRLLAVLPPRRQEAITLRFFGGLRNQEIARVLGLDERTVASHLSRGLTDLHRAYVEETQRLRIEGVHEHVRT